MVDDDQWTRRRGAPGVSSGMGCAGVAQAPISAAAVAGSKEAKIRLETMVRTSDGFEISEQDLKIRGPGDVMGTQQSGVLDFKLADLARDGQIVQLSKNDVDQILKEDVNLSTAENLVVKKELIRQMKLKPNWSNIS